MTDTARQFRQQASCTQSESMTPDIQNVMQVMNDCTNILRVELGEEGREEFSATDLVYKIQRAYWHQHDKVKPPARKKAAKSGPGKGKLSQLGPMGFVKKACRTRSMHASHCTHCKHSLDSLRHLCSCSVILHQQAWRWLS